MISRLVKGLTTGQVSLVVLMFFITIIGAIMLATAFRWYNKYRMRQMSIEK